MPGGFREPKVISKLTQCVGFGTRASQRTSGWGGLAAVVERNRGRKEGVMEEYPTDLHLAFSDINEFEKYSIRNDEASVKELAVQIWDGLMRDVFKFDMKDLKDASYVMEAINFWKG